MIESPAWHDDAACNGPEAVAAARILGAARTIEVWFPDKRHAEWAYSLARPVCAGCPVLADCAAAIAAHPSRHGMWAGLSPEERGQYRRASRVRVTPQQKAERSA